MGKIHTYAVGLLLILTTLNPSVRIHTIASRITPNVVFYVPKTTDPLQLIQLGPCEIERNSIQGHPKALTAYYGNLSQSNIGDSPTQCLINDENES